MRRLSSRGLGGTRGIGLALRCALVWGCELGCGSSDEAPSPGLEPPRREDAREVDPVVVEIGARRVPVRCAWECDGARAELGQLRERCIDDPTSTPHHVVAAGTSLVALGCCTDAMTAYRQACGIEALEACASRWIAECDAGRIAPAGTAAAGESRR